MNAYWDYPTATSPYWSTTTNGTATNTSTTQNYTWRTTNTSRSTGTSATSNWSYIVTYSRFLVELPEHWSEEDEADFTYLVNDATKTGFTVEMIIRGEVKVADPSIERRSMKDFLPLLKRAANATDRQIIAEFFEAHPIIAPSEPKS